MYRPKAEKWYNNVARDACHLIVQIVQTADINKRKNVLHSNMFVIELDASFPSVLCNLMEISVVPDILQQESALSFRNGG